MPQFSNLRGLCGGKGRRQKLSWPDTDYCLHQAESLSSYADTLQRGDCSVQGPCFGLWSFHQLSLSLSHHRLMCSDRRPGNKAACLAGVSDKWHLIPPVCNLLVVRSEEWVPMKANGSLAPTKSQLMFNENSHDLYGPLLRHSGAQAAGPLGVKGQQKQPTERESHLTQVQPERRWHTRCDTAHTHTWEEATATLYTHGVWRSLHTNTRDVPWFTVT